MTTNLIHGDCLDMMNDIPDGTVDAVITDLPYGTTACKWDVVIPFDKLWEQLKRVRKNNAAVVLFGQEPFSSALRISNIKEFRYDWIWEKERFSNVLCVKNVPGKVHEIISVFYSSKPTYNPQMEDSGKPLLRTNKPKDGIVGSVICSSGLKVKPYEDKGIRFPRSVLRFKRDVQVCSIHPTQKPVALIEYIVRTYTNAGDTVLDATMGSGTTGVACVNTNRNFIGIEKDAKYFDIAKARIEKARISSELTQGEFEL